MHKQTVKRTNPAAMNRKDVLFLMLAFGIWTTVAATCYLSGESITKSQQQRLQTPFAYCVVKTSHVLTDKEQVVVLNRYCGL